MRTRQNEIATHLISLEEAVAMGAEDGYTAVEEIRQALQGLTDAIGQAERQEMEVWLLSHQVHGEAIRTARASEWTSWHQKMTAKAGEIRQKLWRIRPLASILTSATAGPSHAACARSGGHVEKVKLPTFSARVEEYHNF